MNKKEIMDSGEWTPCPLEILSNPHLTKTAKLVFLALIDHLRNGKDWVYPSVSRLMKMTSSCRSSVLAGIQQLAEAGILNTKKSIGKSTRYRIDSIVGTCMENIPETEQSFNQSNSATKKPSPTDPRVKVFIDRFSEIYESQVEQKYIVAGAKDGKIVKQLLKALDGKVTDPMAELERATRNMLTDQWGRSRASIGLLASQINTWRNGTAKTKPTGGNYPEGRR